MEENIWHVAPIDDLREHQTDLKRSVCWCHPEIEECPRGILVIHNSLDGREKYETGERKWS